MKLGLLVIWVVVIVTIWVGSAEVKRSVGIPAAVSMETGVMHEALLPPVNGMDCKGCLSLSQSIQSGGVLCHEACLHGGREASVCESVCKLLSHGLHAGDKQCALLGFCRYIPHPDEVDRAQKHLLAAHSQKADAKVLAEADNVYQTLHLLRHASRSVSAPASS